MSGMLIIAYGSELRGDDALGPLAARLLDATISRPGLRILDFPSLTPELAADLATADLVLFLDCCQEGPVGEVVSWLW